MALINQLKQFNKHRKLIVSAVTNDPLLMLYDLKRGFGVKDIMDINAEIMLWAATTNPDEERLNHVLDWSEPLREKELEYLGMGQDDSSIEDVFGTHPLYLVGTILGSIASNVRGKIHFSAEEKKLINGYKRKRREEKKAKMQEEKIKDQESGLIKSPETMAEFNSYLSENRHVVIDMYGNHCAPCVAMSPVYREAAKDFSSAVFLKANTRDLEALTEHLSIKGIPTVIAFEDGKEKARMSGFGGKSDLYSFLEENLN